MNDRSRLIKLLDSAAYDLHWEWCEEIADHLIENGVLAPPCKAGDTAYFVLYDGVADEWYISEEPIVDVCTKGFYTSGHKDSTENGDLWEWSDVGETVFFSREKAEKALRKESIKND